MERSLPNQVKSLVKCQKHLYILDFTEDNVTINTKTKTGEVLLFWPTHQHYYYHCYDQTEYENRRRKNHTDLCRAPHMNWAELPLGIVWFFGMSFRQWHIPTALQSTVQPMESNCAYVSILTNCGWDSYLQLPNYSIDFSSVWWCSRLRSTILAKILASRGAFAAAAAARRTLGAPAFCIRVTWCTACRPPGMVNYKSKNRPRDLFR